jgi:hypothetical protein
MVVLNPVMMVGTIMLVKQVYSPSFRENPGVVVAGRCRGRRTSSGVVVAGQVLFILIIFQNKSLPSLCLALGVLCVGVVVAGRVAVWWSPDKYFLF